MRRPNLLKPVFFSCTYNAFRRQSEQKSFIATDELVAVRNVEKAWALCLKSLHRPDSWRARTLITRSAQRWRQADALRPKRILEMDNGDYAISPAQRSFFIIGTSGRSQKLPSSKDRLPHFALWEIALFNSISAYAPDRATRQDCGCHQRAAASSNLLSSSSNTLKTSFRN